ncbi:MAG: glycosyltransferase family 4 protein, partial [Candidatus Woesearchaeota archaeon]|nr:glycosyltransferase family 4 protein [Candidatus Woesearchaeota archaeon]
MISEFFPPLGKGGGEISASLLARELAKRKIDVQVLTSFEKFKKDETIEGVKIFRRIKSGKPNSLIGNIRRAFEFEKSLLIELEKLDTQEDYDIIHCMNTNSISAVKSKLKKKYVMHVNGPVPFCPKGTLMHKDAKICHKECTRKTYLDCYMHSKIFGKMELNPVVKFNPLTIYFARKRYEDHQRLMREFDFFMPISSFMKAKLLEMNLEDGKIDVIYNVLDHEKFKMTKGNGVLYIGEYTKAKGAHIAFEALNGEELNADFYGEGNLKEYLLKNAKKNIKIHDRADYKDVPRIIGEHEIIVFPSLVGEAFGRAALEAAISGKIVIASRIGGITDIIEDKITGFLVEPGNAMQIRTLIRKISKKQVTLNTERSRKILIDRFSNEKNISKVIDIYRRLLD